jgi:hypothetical protein
MSLFRVLIALLLVLAPFSAVSKEMNKLERITHVAQAAMESGAVGADAASAVSRNADLKVGAPVRSCPGKNFGHSLCTSFIATPVKPVSCTTRLETRLSGPLSDGQRRSHDLDSIFHPPRS